MSATTTEVPTPMLSFGSKGMANHSSPPGPDPAGVVLPPDLARDDSGIAHHPLDPVEHASTLFSGSWRC